MVAYNFHPDLARDVVFGRKVSAVKPASRKGHVKVEQMVHGFCGNLPPDWSKSPDCHRLITAPCTRSDPIEVHFTHVLVNGRPVTNHSFLEQLAREEGFADFGSYQAHLDRMHGLPFSGQYIRWAHHKAEFLAGWPLVPRASQIDPEDTE